MQNEPSWLLDFQRQEYSQHGEDGVIEKILGLLPENDHWCVEFGAWDGLFLSNTRNLIRNHGYKAVLIEAGTAKFAELQRNYADNDNVIPKNAFVGFTPADGLDAILETLPIPRGFDFLSIDIDGNDYHVWAAISQCRPKLICIEFNPTIPTELRFIQPRDPELNQGTSLLSLVELGKEKGYELVSVLKANAFFVDEKYFSLFGIGDNSPGALRRDVSTVTYIRLVSVANTL